MAKRSISSSSTPPLDDSDQIARLACLDAHAIEVFGSKNIAHKWMYTPILALNGKTPLQHADTSSGVSEVEALLGRIAYGVYS